MKKIILENPFKFFNHFMNSGKNITYNEISFKCIVLAFNLLIKLLKTFLCPMAFFTTFITLWVLELCCALWLFLMFLEWPPYNLFFLWLELLLPIYFATKNVVPPSSTPFGLIFNVDQNEIKWANDITLNKDCMSFCLKTI